MTKNYGELAIKEYGRLKGVIGTSPKAKLDSLSKLSTYYTPGVAKVSQIVAAKPNALRNYTWARNSVAVVSNGSAVLGLGNIGARAALPVMEGKSLIFKNFADIDAVPIVVDATTEDDLVNIIKAIAPGFGGINLEDIAAPICFNVEARLKEILDIPVFHDDQHGTAIVVLAGLINACKVASKDLSKTRIVISGAGAAGTAIAVLINAYSPDTELVILDSKGVISKQRQDLNKEKQGLLSFTNPNNINGNLTDALKGSDIFIGVSAAGALKQEYLKSMKKEPIVFAMANPVPEIMPDQAKAAGAVVVATGRSDFPNQINNALVFPGVFRGALDNGVKDITIKHKINAAKALASLITKPTPDKIIPSVLDKSVVKALAKCIV